MQDGTTEAAVGQQSYNELVALLVNILGDDTPTHLLTPTAVAAHSREASFSSRASRTAALTPSVGRCGGSRSVQASSEPEAAVRDVLALMMLLLLLSTATIALKADLFT